jgi:hypothetical protein
MIHLVSIGFMAASLTAAADEPLLSPGNPAPRFSPNTFIRGEPLDGLSPGTIYVIEFSGTACAPCVKEIPHLEALRRAHGEAVFVSVFSEPEGDVRRYLDGPGKGITLRVACDPKRTLWDAWSAAAGQFGIPHVFVVDRVGKVAWIGHPWNLDEPLARIVAGKPIDPVDPVEEMRRRIHERERWASEENNQRVSQLMREGKLEDAIHALDHLIETCSDLPSADAFRARKLFVLALIPGRREEAFSFALELAVDAKSGGNLTAVAASNYIMNHYEKCLLENRDERMLHLALALLNDDTAPGDESSRSLSTRSYHLQALSRAYALQRDKARAVATLRQAITIEEKLCKQLQSGKHAETELNDQRSQIAELSARLAAMEKSE